MNERIKEAPAHALRAIFAGIGQVLLAADKVRNRVQEQLAQAPGAARPGTSTAPGPAQPAAAQPAPGPAAPPRPAEAAQPATAAAAPPDSASTGNVRV
ncbi:MAG: hypothetical protein J2P35_24470, partial [Actinobacteria bacterium]|nr:hypothetical protein [Actinomycetota bacterium]